jgi:hypothetical protein
MDALYLDLGDLKFTLRRGQDLREMSLAVVGNGLFLNRVVLSLS